KDVALRKKSFEIPLEPFEVDIGVIMRAEWCGAVPRRHVKASCRIQLIWLHPLTGLIRPRDLLFSTYFAPLRDRRLALRHFRFHRSRNRIHRSSYHVVPGGRDVRSLVAALFIIRRA